ncbi:MAG: ATP-binding protein [Coriobacteriia bacterium]|nr:ATP-binding protein [Coriobacteriia bacterium]
MIYAMATLAAVRFAVVPFFVYQMRRRPDPRYRLLTIAWVVYALSPLARIAALLIAPGFQSVFLAFAVMGSILLVVGVMTYFVTIRVGRVLLLAGISTVIMIVAHLVFPWAESLTLVAQSVLLLSGTAYGMARRRAFMAVGGSSYYWLLAVFLVAIATVAVFLITGEQTSPFALTTAMSVVIALFLVQLENDSDRLQLEVSQRRYRALFDGSADPVLLLGEDGTVRGANALALTQYGYTEDELTGLHLADLDGSGTEALISGIVDELSRRESVTVEFSIIARDGRIIPVEMSARIMEQGGERIILAVVRDVTEQRRIKGELEAYRLELERLVAERTAQLEDANRDLLSVNEELARVNVELLAASRAKSAFLANMSHELRTPLNSIIGFTGIMLQGLAGPLADEQRRQLGMVRASGAHLLSLINDVLDLSKVESGTVELAPERVDLRACARELVETLLPLAQSKGLTLTVEDGDPVLVEVDPRALQQILFNLVGNAIKFTRSGSVTVRIGREGAQVAVSVADTGVGIAASELPGIFKAFRQVTSPDQGKPQGTGLGLTLSTRFAEMLGGTIDARSEVGQGSVFTLTMPCRSGPGQGADDPSQ